LRPARLLGLLTPLAVMVALVALLLVPNLIMHTGLYSNANSTVSPPGQDAPSQRAAAAVESPPVMR
jgi:predicted cobalt transporter CbtA